MNRYQRSVQRGAAYLTERDGAGWIDRLNLAALDIDNSRKCVLGQLHWLGSFYHTQESDEGPRWLMRHGFVVPGAILDTIVHRDHCVRRSRERRAARLTQAWREHVAAARLARSTKDNHNVPITT